MDYFQKLLILLLFASIASTLAFKLKKPVEVLLLLGSLLLSLVPGLPMITIPPQMIFIIFIPPLLFSAAFFTSWRDFVNNRRPITLLAVGLVLFTMCGVAITLKWLIPDMAWAECFLFGAIVSPTDASAATTIVKKFGIPRRLITIIEGESLINDATALIAYRFSLLAFLTGGFSLFNASLIFLIASIGGVLVGYIIGLVSVHFYAWLNHPNSQNVFTLFVPYAAYIIADRLGISPVICIVTAGIYFSRKIPLVSTAEFRRSADTIWEFYIFVINSLIYILIGLQLPVVIRGVSDFSIKQLIGYAIAVNLVIILIRIIWVYPAAYIPRFLSPKLLARDPYPSWQQLAMIGWLGMRGIVSLTIVMAIPYVLPSGMPFPYRSLLILLTYSVIIVTLLLPTLTLPTVLKIFNFERDLENYREESLARVASMKAVLDQLRNIPVKQGEVKEYVAQMCKRYSRKIGIFESNLKSEQPYSQLDAIDQQIRKLSKDLINTERTVLLKLRTDKSIHDSIFHQLERELDIEELRLKTPRV